MGWNDLVFKSKCLKYLIIRGLLHAIRNTGVLGVTSIPGFSDQKTDFQEKLGKMANLRKNWGKMKIFDKNLEK